MSLHKRTKGFTLIELLIVIAIIAILATIIIISYVNAQKKARDNRRKADIQTIASAYQIYNQETKAWYIPGTGSSGGGQGWFNYENGTTYPKSMARGLEEGGYISKAPWDPLQKDGNDTSTSYRYMKYQSGCIDGNHTTVYAKLEIPSDEDIANASDGCYASRVGPGTSYNMSFAVSLK